MTPHRIKSISEFHRYIGLPQPQHPLISIVDYAAVAAANAQRQPPPPVVFDYFSISVKRGLADKLRYGQQQYDFDDGVMYFLAPGQVLQSAPGRGDEEPSGWILLIHPDFLWNTPLASAIRQYGFFDYSVHEALFLSEKEEATLANIIEAIRQEYNSNIDKFSQRIIISQIETLLNYAERFYQRQFITRSKSNHSILQKLEALLDQHFADEAQASHGLPTVQQVAAALHISPNYLSSLLKVLTGQSTQQHIQEKLVQKAKEKLSTTNLSVNEVAYSLGFEHPQSFSKFFKSKTSQSPLEFRESFN